MPHRRDKKHAATREGDLFRARLDQFTNTKHELVQLAGKIDGAWIDGEIALLHSDKGRPGIESRFVIGLLLLKYMFGLSHEGVCERWVYDPYFQHFTGEEFFQHTFPHERADLSHWRRRLGEKPTCCWPRACGWLIRAVRCAPETWRGHGRHHRAAQEHRLPDRR